MKKILLILLVAISIPFVAFAAGFKDTASHKYKTAIEFIQAKGIVDGYPDGTYRPDQTMNRAEMLTIIVGSKYKDLPKKDCFPDVKSVDWFSPFVCKGKELGVVKGYGDGSFKPAKTVNFVEALIMLQRAYEIDIDPDSGDVWYEDSVRKASETNIIPLDVSGFEMSLTRGHMAELMTRLIKEKDGSLAAYLGDKVGTKITYESLLGGVKSVATVTSSNLSETLPAVYINGNKLSKAQIDELKSTYGKDPDAGRFWYDTKSGLFGLEKSSAIGFMKPGHSFGVLARTASGGSTGVTINGRELENLEYSFLSQLVGYQVLPGNYWFDEKGNMGVVGAEDVPLTNYWLLLINANAVSGAWSSGATGAGGNSSGGCSYINIPGSSGISDGFYTSPGCG